MSYADGDCPETDDELYAPMNVSRMSERCEKYMEALEIIAGYDNDQYRSVRTLLGSAIKVAQAALRNPDGSWTTR